MIAQFFFKKKTQSNAIHRWILFFADEYYVPKKHFGSQLLYTFKATNRLYKIL